MFCPFASRYGKGSSSAEMRWAALGGGLMPGASFALTIDTAVQITCSSMTSVFEWTVMMAKGPITLGFTLLQVILASI